MSVLFLGTSSETESPKTNSPAKFMINFSIQNFIPFFISPLLPLG